MTLHGQLEQSLWTECKNEGSTVYTVAHSSRLHKTHINTHLLMLWWKNNPDETVEKGKLSTLILILTLTLPLTQQAMFLYLCVLTACATEHVLILTQKTVT